MRRVAVQNYGLFPHLTVAAECRIPAGASGDQRAGSGTPLSGKLLAGFRIETIPANRLASIDLSSGQKQSNRSGARVGE